MIWPFKAPTCSHPDTYYEYRRDGGADVCVACGGDLRVVQRPRLRIVRPSPTN